MVPDSDIEGICRESLAEPGTTERTISLHSRAHGVFTLLTVGRHAIAWATRDHRISRPPNLIGRRGSWLTPSETWPSIAWRLRRGDGRVRSRTCSLGDRGLLSARDFYSHGFRN